MTRRAHDRDALTPANLRVLHAIANGQSTTQAAKDLWLAEQTIKHHLREMFRKLSVSNRGQLVWRALDLGILDPPKPSENTPVLVRCPHCELRFDYTGPAA